MASSATAVDAIPSAPSSTLSPNAAPFTLPGRRHDGDVSRSMDDNLVMYGEGKRSWDTHSASPIAHVAMESCNTICAPSTHGVHPGQPNSWPVFSMDAHPSSTCSSSGMVSASSMVSNYKEQNILTLGNGSRCSTLKIESPISKTSETDKNSCGSGSKLVIRENTKSNKETSFPRNLQISNPGDADRNSKGPTIYNEDANPAFNAKPLHISTKCVDPCDLVADDMIPDPSECSVDSPCWRGASTSCLSPFGIPQMSTPQSTNKEVEALDAGLKKSSGTIQQHEAPSELKNLVTNNCKNKQNQSQGHVELGMPKKSGNIGTNQAKDSYVKKLECTNQCATQCTAEQKQCLELKGNCMKQSGLNSAAPDFVPSSMGKLKIDTGPCPSARRNISGIFKAIENLTEVLKNSYSDGDVELGEHDYVLLESVIENLQNCLHKTRKGPIKGASDKTGLMAPHPQTTVLKSDAGKYNGSYIADGGKGIIVNGFAGSSHVLNDFGKSISTRSQPSLNNFRKKISCEEEHSQVIVYKNLWIDAERANCELKHQLKDIRVKLNLESCMAHTSGPRNNYFQVSDLGTDSCNSYGAALAHPPMLSFSKDHPPEETSGAKNSQNFYSGDCTQSGGNGAHSCSSSTKGYTTLPLILQSDHFPTGLEETSMHRHAHPGMQLAPSTTHKDGVSTSSYITGMAGHLRGNSEYGSSDWEHVLKEEIGWS